MNPFVGSWYRFAADGTVIDRDAVPQGGSMAPQNTNRGRFGGNDPVRRDRVHSYDNAYARQRLRSLARF